ncbi:MAG: PDZ domain-containing protein [Bacteroidetes bacterium]|nr:PDZ domain-containing protein [Bacteroidota bacterium]MBS1756377.1 PDZ domain-containing protein [Bacteroidota bacterium]
MKKIVLAFLPWLLASFCYKAMAQDEKVTTPKNNKSETQEIIIRKNGDKDAKLNVEINGDQVLINGKPISEYKDDDISINKKKIIIRNGDKMMMLDGLGNMNFDFDTNGFNTLKSMGNKALLGVSTDKDDKGAKIMEVTKESGAEKAGLQVGDIITKVGDKKITTPQSLTEAIGALKPKDQVKIHYLHNGKEKSTKATLQERKISNMRTFTYTGPEGFKSFTMPKIEGMPMMPKIEGQNWEYENNFGNIFNRRPKLGIKIQDTDDGSGVKVLDVEDSSAAALAGIRKDDVITSIGDKEVKNTDEARAELQMNTDKTSYPVKVKRAGAALDLTIKIPKKLKTANL